MPPVRLNQAVVTTNRQSVSFAPGFGSIKGRSGRSRSPSPGPYNSFKPAADVAQWNQSPTMNITAYQAPSVPRRPSRDISDQVNEREIATGMLHPPNRSPSQSPAGSESSLSIVNVPIAELQSVMSQREGDTRAIALTQQPAETALALVQTPATDPLSSMFQVQEPQQEITLLRLEASKKKQQGNSAEAYRLERMANTKQTGDATQSQSQLTVVTETVQQYEERLLGLQAAAKRTTDTGMLESIQDEIYDTIPHEFTDRPDQFRTYKTIQGTEAPPGWHMWKRVFSEVTDKIQDITRKGRARSKSFVDPPPKAKKLKSGKGFRKSTFERPNPMDWQ